MSDTSSASTPAVGETLLDAPPDAIPPPDVVPEPEPVAGPSPQRNDPNVVQAKRCDKCETSGARNLVICIDGTSNQFSKKNTNVVELYSRLVKDKTQLTFYNSGIGTYAKPSWKSWSYRKQVIANKLDLAFALRFEKIILSAYAWLVDNYEDRIFLFGFSRGAYQVRALAAMISVVGLLYKGNNDQIPFAYELYAASGDEDMDSRSRMDALRRISAAIATRVKGVLKQGSVTETGSGARPSTTERSMQDLFKTTFSQPNVGVHFVGAWDTVSSVGFIRDKTLPKTTDGMKCTCFFRHALALHEFRVKFLPEYVNGSHGPDPEKLPPGNEPHTKEVWFSGSHSDIGGGSTTNTTLDQFGPALRWMSHEGELAGLRIKPGPRSWTLIQVSESMTLIWRIVECFPIKRLSFNNEEVAPRSGELHKSTGRPGKPATTWIPHLCAHRRIQSGQLIYGPVNSQDVPFKLPKDARKEEDAFMEAIIVLRPLDEALHQGCILDDRNSALLQALVSSEKGIKSLEELNIIGYIHHMLQSCWDKEGTQEILKNLRTIYTRYVQALVQFNAQINLSDVVTFPFDMGGHAYSVSSVAFLSDTRVGSGSYDRTLRIWDVSTGEMTLGSPLSDHSNEVNCVAVHTASGLVASASSDSTIRLWTSDSNGDVHAGEVLQDGSSHSVLAVAFSPDGSHLVSGSENGAIRVWNAATGKRVGEPVRGHTGWVWSIAFSSDGQRIVSGSSDETVRLWEWSPDEATLKPWGEPLKGHTGWVLSVAFSPDTSLIASGSGDKTVRIWDLATRTSKFTLEGHTDTVRSVAFAPSGNHIVSGSRDWKMRIWDARTGAAVRVLRGHTDVVLSVAFSPDGTRIASGSVDKTVRVWDFVPPRDESHPDEDVQAAAPAQIEPSQRR